MAALNPLSRVRRRLVLLILTLLITFLILIHHRLYPSSPYAQYSQYSLDLASGLASDTYGKVKGYIASRVGDVFENTLYTEGGDVYSEFNFSMPCQGFPEVTDNILLIMKTGATEAFDKLPTQLLTSLQCLPDFLLFSDMEQQIGAYHVHDALDTVAESIKAHNGDFDLYRSQRECPISQKACVDPKQNGKNAWNLDKYKFLHVMEKAWTMRPGRDWYVFAEADSYVFWSNLVGWLRGEFGELNPRERHYIGSVAMLGGTRFAHGGSGYVLSGPALRRLVEGGQGVARRFDHLANEHCCGDALVSMALRENGGTAVKQLHPHFNGEKPSTIPYGPTHWCEPILTMHHMDSEEIMQVWQFEQTRKSTGLLLFKDLYTTLIAPKMDVYRPDWDNLSEDVCYRNPSGFEDPDGNNNHHRAKFDGKIKISGLTEVEKTAYKSFEDCAKVCEQEDIEEIEGESDMELDDEAKELALLMIKGEELKREREGHAPKGEDTTLDAKQTQLQARNDADRVSSEESGASTAGASSTVPTTESATAGATSDEYWLTEEEEARARAYLEYQAKKEEVKEKRKAKKCFQYRWNSGMCCTSKAFKLGVPRRTDSHRREDKWLSGWDLKGINDWIEAMGECEPKWRQWNT